MNRIRIKSITKKTSTESRRFYGLVDCTNGNYVSNGLISKNCGMMDEMDFYVPGSQKKDIFKLYNQLRSRIESRMISRGLIRNSKLVLLSSKRSQSDFLESYIKRVKKDPLRSKQLYLVDRPIWEVKTQDYPPDAPSFQVAVGNSSLPSLIIDDQDPSIYEDQGYRIIKVPESLRLSFESDINLALQDKAGIALSNELKFLPSSKISKAFENKSVILDPFTTQSIITSLDDESSIADYLLVDRLKLNAQNERLYIHGDLAYANDRLGLAASVLRTTQIINKVAGKEVTTIKVYPQPVFYITLESARGQEINLNKVSQFIKELDELGFDIGRVSFDGFQSRALIQDLTKYNATVISVDRPINAYEYYKTLLQSEYISLYYNKLLEFESNNVVKDIQANKVDHTQDGSKDLLDAVVGSCYNAITSQEASKLAESYSMNYSVATSPTNPLPTPDLAQMNGIDSSSDISTTSNFDNIFGDLDKL